MAFDKNLDKELFSETIEFEKTKISVSVYSYNGGTKKLQISRENKSAAGEYSFSKLGRLLKEEIVAILPAINKAIEHL
ncbi:MAG: hypothetical protein ABIG84_02390 [archaeon]